MKKNFLKKMTGCLLALALAAVTVVPAFAEEAETEDAEEEEEVTYELSVGAAVRDITPTEENGLLPIEGVGNTTLVGVLDNIHVRVIALNDGESTALIVCTETGRGPYGPQFVQALSDHTGVDLDAIFCTATHSHAVPEITEELDYDFDDDDPDVTNLQRWGKLVMEQMFDAADEAMANMEPATMGYGFGESYINVNRNRTYTDEDGNEYRSQGYNPTGDSDKTLAVIEFDNMDGDPIAFIVNYAVHGVVMYANQCIDGGTGVSSDIPGYVSNCLEEVYPGCVGMWISGAAGNQNPIFGNEIFTPSIETGEAETTYAAGGDLEILDYLGKIQFADVKDVIKGIDKDEMTSDVKITYEYGESTIPAEPMEEGGSDEYTLSLSLLRLGDLALVGSPGELFSSIGEYMKENSILDDTIIVNHVWTHEGQRGGYMTDDEGKILGGFGTNANYLRGYVNSGLSMLMNDLIYESEED